MTTRLIFGGLAACAAALSLAACNKPAAPADAAPADAPPPASAPADAPAAAATAPAGPALPADMQAQAEHAEMCEHFAGEEPYDAARRKELEDAMKENCGPLEDAMPALKAAHGSDPALKPTLDHWAELVQ